MSMRQDARSKSKLSVITGGVRPNKSRVREAEVPQVLAFFKRNTSAGGAPGQGAERNPLTRSEKCVGQLLMPRSI
jgi:hypothetical protein